MRRLPLPSASGAVRAAVVAALATGAVLAPIRMAQGTPRTRFAALPAGIPDGGPGSPGAARVAAAAGPAAPGPAGAVLTSRFPISHLGARWRGSESAAVEVRLAGAGGGWGPWRPLVADHDLDNGDGGPVLSELIRADGARRAQLRAVGDARDVELLAIDSQYGPRPLRVATGTRPAAAAGSSGTTTTTTATTTTTGRSATTTTTAGRSATTTTTAGGDERRASATASSTTSSSSTSSSTTTTTAPRKKPAVAEPPIITRKEWGADESIRKNNQKYAPITKLFVHHTVTSPDGPDPDPAATVRAIYVYHVQGNGWD